MEGRSLWEKYRQYLFADSETGFALDLSRMNFEGDFLVAMEPRMQQAFAAMDLLVGGAIANPDEQRMVGHYWLRNPELAPAPEIRREIIDTTRRIQDFASDIHTAKIKTKGGQKFEHILLIGIGGSALGPQFVTQALSTAKDPLDIYFFDNTDPDGMQRVLESIPNLAKTLCIVISKSGGTRETRNGQLIAKAAWDRAGLDFCASTVAITMFGSDLDKVAVSEGWLARFPMWDWIGGRTSELSAVGMLPAALQGFDVSEILSGARMMDELTSRRETLQNPAALMALMWYHAGCGKGLKDMVVLPYKDRLELFSRYLQQLVMESLGKEFDLGGSKVNQGIAVYGNKGSTDQHAYVQQLREGLNNFFAIFIEVLKDGAKSGGHRGADFSAVGVEVDPKTYAGDYLAGFFMGTRTALFEKNRESITMTIEEVSARSVGLLIALFERAVGFYASLININAYHQPGVEAGKKAAGQVLTIQQKIMAHLSGKSGVQSAEEIASGIGESSNIETVFKLLWRLGANGRLRTEAGASIFENKYGISH